MALFTGTYADAKIDGKGRATLPPKFRGELPPENNREIYIYPSPTQDYLEASDREFIEQLRDSEPQNPYTDEDDEDSDTAWVLAEALSVTIDTAGRIVIPPDLVEEAGIGGKVVFVGRGFRFLIMSDAAHGAYKSRRRERRQNRKKSNSERSQ